MVSFVSTVAEKVTVLEQHDDGRERMAIATRLPDGSNSIYSTPKWSCELIHPSGQVYTETFSGTRSEVSAAMGNWMQSKDDDFRRDKFRGDQPLPEIKPLAGTRPVPSAPVLNTPYQRTR